MSTNRYANLKIQTKDSEAVIEGEIPVSIIASYETDALEHARKELALPGFRKGQVPLDLVRKSVNPMHILEDAAQDALRDVYEEIIEDEKLEPLSRPEVTITKLAPGNPVGFKITVGLVPEFSLPDYRKLAKGIMETTEPIEVTDKEVDETVEHLLEFRKRSPADPTPELTDAVARSLGKFETVADLKQKIRDGITEEKQAKARGKKREELAARLVEATKMTIPESAIAHEAEATTRDREEHIKQSGLSREDYFKTIKRTEAELGASERVHIERQLKTKFVLERIAAQEKIAATPDELGRHVEVLRRQYPDAKPEHLARYAMQMIVNEKTLQFLEGNGKLQNSNNKPNPEP